ncbi:hypothetical protein GCM10010207_81090 [Streptomyces atratus]|nr:hypothetical protein GCM10010207_81090 [Streptomyces atratus]
MTEVGTRCRFRAPIEAGWSTTTRNRVTMLAEQADGVIGFDMHRDTLATGRATSAPGRRDREDSR